MCNDLVYNWAAMFHARRKLKKNMTEEEIDEIINLSLSKFQLMPRRTIRSKKIEINIATISWITEENIKGKTFKDIAKDLGISRVTMMRRLKEFERSKGNYEDVHIEK